MTLPNLLALAVIFVAVPFNWYVFVVSYRLGRGSDNWALRVHTVRSFALAVIVTVFAVVFVNNDMAVPLLDSETTRIITRLGMLALIVPGVYWLYLVRKA